MDKETREFLESKFSTLNQRFARVDEQFARVDQRFSGIGEKFEETKRYFSVVAESLRSEVQQIADGHQIILDAQTRIVGRIEQAEREVGAMIRFSYAELDRRIGALEEEVLTLKTRVDRIEARQG